MTDERRNGSDRRKAPAFQWYPGDWRRDTALQTCSLGARGLWLEMLNIMHDATPRGHLRVPGRIIDASKLAHMVAAPFDEVVLHLKELEAAGVFSRDRAGCIYCRRMVRDERVQKARKKGGYKSLKHPNVPRPKSVETQGVAAARISSKGIPKGGTADPSPAVAVAVANQNPSASPNRMSRYVGAWSRRFQTSAPPAGRIGKALKPLLDERPDDEVFARWQRFMDSPESKYGPEYFAQRYSEWAPKRPDQYARGDEIARQLGEAV